jgi:ABC-2 type transport system ATP-binding protein
MYRNIGLVPERESVYSFLTGFEFVRLSARLHKLPDPDAAARKAIKLVDMEAAQDRPTGGYSKGMKQRVKIAASIVHEPPVLLLDEPFNGADPRQRLQMIEMLRTMAAEGCTIVFSSHILEEVERLAENVLVVVSGRLAASGDFREIRRLMTDRPHTFNIRSSDNRRLASALVADPAIFGVELLDERLSVQTSDFAAFTRAVTKVARAADVTLFELKPTDESLESVFSYLVQR